MREVSYAKFWIGFTAEAIEGFFGMDVDYAKLIKLYGSPRNPDTRYGSSFRRLAHSISGFVRSAKKMTWGNRFALALFQVVWS